MDAMNGRVFLSSVIDSSEAIPTRLNKTAIEGKQPGWKVDKEAIGLSSPTILYLYVSSEIFVNLVFEHIHIASI